MKKLLAAATAVFFAVVLAVAGAAAPASAHDATLSGSATCTSDGAATVIWTLTNDYNEVANVIASDNPTIPKGAQVAANGGHGVTHSSFTQTVPFPAASKTVTATLTVQWTGDGYTSKNPVKGSVTVASDCAAKDASAAIVDHAATCSAGESVTEGSIVNATWVGGVSVSGGSYTATAKANANHAFSDGTTTKTFHGSLASALTTGCVPTDASAAIVDTAATCTAGETVTEGAISNADWVGGVQVTGSTYTVTAKAKDGHAFPAGAGVSKDGSTKTFTGTLDGKKTTDCTPKDYVIVAWKMPSWAGTTTPTWPQTIYAHQTETTPDLNALDSKLALTCGTQYQIDIYNDSTTTSSLIAGGQLLGPNSPHEDLIAGGWGVAYKLVHEPDCVAPPTPKDASFDVHVTAPTCTAPAKLVYGTATNATVNSASTPNGTTGPGSYDVIANSTAGHQFDASKADSSHAFSQNNTKEEITGTLDGALGTQSTSPSSPCYVAPPKDADASVMVTAPTCTTAATLVYGDITNATFNGGSTPNHTAGPGSYSVTATAKDGHVFDTTKTGTGISYDSDGTTKTFGGSLAGALGFQSSNPTADCYVAPPKDAKATITVTDATCTTGQVVNYGTTENAKFDTAASTADGTAGPGSYTIVADADTDHVFNTSDADSSHSYNDAGTTETFTGTLSGPIPTQDSSPSGPCYVAPPADAKASVSVVPATCTTPAMLTYGSTVNASFDTDHSTADGATGDVDSTYTVIADADAHHAFNTSDADSSRSYNADGTVETFTGTLAVATGYQSTNSDAPCYVAPPIAVGDPNASTCGGTNDATALTSWVFVDLENHVNYTIQASGSATVSPITTAYTSEPAGTYTIVATTDAGYTLAATATHDAGTTRTWTLTVADEDCTLPTEAAWHADASATPAVCTSSTTQAGTITLEHLASEAGKVRYTVTNKSTGVVVYTGTKATKVSVAPGTYTVHAAAVKAGDGISTQSNWTLTVAAATAACGSLTTLAFTGVAPTLGLFLAGAMLFLGIAGIFMRRRFGRHAE